MSSAAGLKFIPGTVITYRGHLGFSWLAWAGRDDYYEEVWYCQRLDSVHPGQPRSTTHADLLEEIGSGLAILPPSQS